MVKKLTNGEMITIYNGLAAFQNMERKYYEKQKKKLLQGRIKIGFGIEKNMEEIKQKLKPYNATLESVISEYRDTEAEQEALKKEREAAKQESRPMRDVNIIIKEDKEAEEYFKKVEELQNIEVDVDVHMVGIDLFDGLDLDSTELHPFIFMIE